MIIPKIFFSISAVSYLLLTQAEKSDNPFCSTKCGKDNIVCKRAPCHLDVEVCSLPSKMLILTQMQRAHMYKLHNYYRNKTAMESTHKSSNMKAVTYNLELEFLAQCWANNCRLTKDECRSTPSFTGTGQNLFVSTKTREAGMETFLNEAVGTWYEGVKQLNKDLLQKYSFNNATAEAAQMVWAETTDFGCGRIRFLDKVVLFCNYAPEGAIHEKPVYEIGEPCSKCTCNKIYVGLCGNSSIMKNDDWTPPFKLGSADVARSSVGFVLGVLVSSILNS